MRRTYVGLRTPDGAVVVYHDAGEDYSHPLPQRRDLRDHSPTGFEWGYAGSGPAQLALALAADLVGDDAALRYYQQLKRHLVVRLPKGMWSLPATEVERVLYTIMDRDEGADLFFPEDRWETREIPF